MKNKGVRKQTKQGETSPLIFGIFKVTAIAFILVFSISVNLPEVLAAQPQKNQPYESSLHKIQRVAVQMVDDLNRSAKNWQNWQVSLTGSIKRFFPLAKPARFGGYGYVVNAESKGLVANQTLQNHVDSANTANKARPPILWSYSDIDFKNLLKLSRNALVAVANRDFDFGILANAGSRRDFASEYSEYSDSEVLLPNLLEKTAAIAKQGIASFAAFLSDSSSLTIPTLSTDNQAVNNQPSRLTRPAIAADKNFVNQILQSSKSVLAPFTQDFLEPRERIVFPPAQGLPGAGQPLLSQNLKNIIKEIARKITDMDIAKLFSPKELGDIQQELTDLQKQSTIDETTLNLLTERISERLPKTPQAVSPSVSSGQTVRETRVVEKETRVVETKVVGNEEKINELTSLLDQLKKQQIKDRQDLFNAIALTNRINTIPSNTTINNVTITNPSFANEAITDAMVIDTITASNYLPLGGGTVTGSLTVDGAVTFGTISSIANVLGNFGMGGDLSVSGGDIQLGTGSATTTITSSSGNLGIGTTSPSQLLSVQGGALIAGTTTLSGFTATGSVLLATAGNRVGIGTLAPATILHLSTGNQGEIARFESTGASSFIKVGVPAGSNTASIQFDVAIGATPDAEVGFDPTNGLGFFVNLDGTRKLVMSQTTGLMGIGTTTPSRLLSVHGGALIAGTTTVADLVATGTLDVRGAGTSTLQNNLRVLGTLQIGSGSTYISSTELNSTGTFTIKTQSQDNHLVLQTLGRVGVASTTPWGVFSVERNGANSAMPILVVAEQGTSSPYFIVNDLGNVGIGTTTPRSLFAVHGSALISGNLNVANLTATGTLNLSGLSTFANATASQLTVTGNTYLATGSGSVGISTTTPSQLLSVQGNALISGTTTVQGLIATNTLMVGGNSGTSFVVKSDGRVGVGTAGPLNPLHIYGSGSSLLRIENSVDSTETNIPFVTAGAIKGYFGYSPAGSLLARTGEGMMLRAAQGVYIGTNGDNVRLAIDTNGNFGLNTPLPLQALHAVGSQILTGDLDIYGADINLGTGLATTTITSASGNLGISTTTPSQLLSVQGNALISGNLNVAGLTTTGTLTLSGSTLFDFKNAGTSTLAQVSNAFSIATSTTARPILSLDGKDGNVGIGTASSTQRLTVVGNIENIPVSVTSPYARNPKLVGSASIIDVKDVRALYVSGRYAYVATFGTSLQIFDISTSSPALVGSATTDNQVANVFVSGEYAYVNTRASETLQIFNISNPKTPALVGRLSGITNSRALFVSGRYAYSIDAVASNAFLRIVDVSNPAVPVLAGMVNTGSGVSESIFVSGHYVYIADYTGSSLRVIDVSNPSLPILVGNSNAGGNPFAVFVSGRYAYVGNDDSTLQVFDVSTSTPALVSSVSTDSSVRSIYVAGRYVYVANTNTLQVFDIFNPSTPVLVGRASIGQDNRSIYISGRYAYVANDTDDNLQVFDIGGLETTSAMVHSLETGNLQVRNDIIAQGQLSIGGGMGVGAGGIYSSGPLAVSATTSLSSILGGLTIGTTTPATSSPNFIAITSSVVTIEATSTGAIPLTIRGAGTQAVNYFQIQNSANLNQLVLSSTGNLGISTTTPSQLLSVQGNALISGTTTVQGLIATNTLMVGGNSGARLIVRSDGNVGIGTANPVNTLQVNTGRIVVGSSDIGGVTTGVATYGATDSAAYGYQAGQTATNNITFGWISRTTATDGYGYMETYAGSNNLQIMRSGGGKIGIGIAHLGTLGSKLSINGNLSLGANYAGTAAPSNGAIIEGDVGIGTTTPSQLLSVQGGALISGTTTVGAFLSTSSIFSVLPSGNVGIGTAAPGGKLEVVGDIISKGTLWTARPATEVNQWRSVIYGNGLFVAVSDNGTNRVMTSPDGITWTARKATEANQWRSVAYSNGLFVAVSYTGTNRVMTSPDGITWTARTAAEANPWFAITYGNGLFVAIADSGTNRVMTSPDGITWTARTAAEANGWDGITYGNGLFVAVATDGTNRVMTSPDGITWTARTAAEANVWRSVVYGNGLFTASASTGTNRVMTSPDGITWTARTAAQANQWFAITYGNGLFVAVADGGTNRVMTSPDGITWTSRTVGDGTWNAITYGNGVFVAAAYDGTNQVITSGKSELNIISTDNIYQGGTTFYGNVGIGTTTPNSTTTINRLLNIAGNSGPQLLLTEPGAGVNLKHWYASTTAGALTFGTLTDNLLTLTEYSRFSSSGQLGISTTTPSQLLSVQGNAIISGTTTLAGFTATGTSYVYNGGGVQADLRVLNGSVCADNNGGTKCTTNVVAGTVYGDTGTFAASDLAENYPISDESIEEGDIVALSNIVSFAQQEEKARFEAEGQIKDKNQEDNQALAELLKTTLIKATPETQNKIIGAISTNPGVLLGDTTGMTINTKTKPVALSGRIPVKVNLEGGTIQSGDPITISSVPGVGKKAAQSGKIVGYALENYNGPTPENNGKVLVFTSLGYWIGPDFMELAQNQPSDSPADNSLISLIVSTIKGWLESLKVFVEDGLVRLKNLVAEKLTASIVEVLNLKVGDKDNPNGITIYDKITKQPYCLIIDNGQIQNVAGECNANAVSPIILDNNATSTPPADTELPVIILNGPSAIEIEIGTNWVDPGATATDNVNDNLGIYYKVDGIETPNGGRELPQIDTSSASAHIITYTSTDAAGNTTSVERTVNVIDPSTSSGQDPSTSSGQDPSTSSGQDPSTSSGQDPSTSSGQDPNAAAAATTTPSVIDTATTTTQ